LVHAKHPDRSLTTLMKVPLSHQYLAILSRVGALVPLFLFFAMVPPILTFTGGSLNLPMVGLLRVVTDGPKPIPHQHVTTHGRARGWG
jgi:hypothetical protein